MKKRLDVLLTEQGFAESREKAKTIIMSGIVYVNNQKEDKPGTQSSFEGWTVASSSSFQNNAGSVPVIEQWNGSSSMGVIDVYVEIVRGLEIIAQRLTILRTGAIAAGGFDE